MAYSGIDQRAHERISNRTDGIPCDGKLAQFDSTSWEEDIGGFNIPVEYVHAMKMRESLKNLS